MRQSDLIAAITARLEADDRIRGLFLSGSFGRSTADAFSDIDLLAVVPAEHHDALAAEWRGVLDAIAPIVFFNRLP